MIPSFKLEPGDGTGCSIADGMKRNEQGMCGSYQCSNFKSNFYFMGVALCDSCSKPFKEYKLEALRKMDEEIIKDFNKINDVHE